MAEVPSLQAAAGEAQVRRKMTHTRLEQPYAIRDRRAINVSWHSNAVGRTINQNQYAINLMDRHVAEKEATRAVLITVFRYWA